MTAFLNLFPSYRAAVEARIKAESESRHDRNRAERAEARVQELSKELIEAHKVVADKLGQRFLGQRIWSEAPAMEKPEHAGIPSRNVKARHLISQIEEQSIRNLNALHPSTSA